MQKQITRFEVKKNERVYQFFMDSESPIGELHDVLIEMREYVIQAIQKTMEMQKTQVKIDDDTEEEQFSEDHDTEEESSEHAGQ